MSFRPLEPSFFGIGSAPASGMPGAPIGPALRSTITVCGVTFEIRIVDALLQILERVEHQRRAFVLEQLRRRRGELDRGAAAARGCR